jgi:hypothetical protein
MKAIIQQEILLVTHSTLSKKQLCEKDRISGIDFLSEAEQLEEACWNGLLSEMLPGIITKSVSGKQLPLWQIRQGVSLLKIELGESIPFFEKECSINPFWFLEKMVELN